MTEEKTCLKVAVVVDLFGDVGDGVPDALGPLVVVAKGGASLVLGEALDLLADDLAALLDRVVRMAAALAAAAGLLDAVELGEEVLHLLVAVALPGGDVGAGQKAAGRGARHQTPADRRVGRERARTPVSSSALWRMVHWRAPTIPTA